MEKFHYCLSDEIYQDNSTTATHISNIIQFLFPKGFIASLLTTIWYHTYGCANHNCCAYDIYILSFIAL